MTEGAMYEFLAAAKPDALTQAALVIGYLTVAGIARYRCTSDVICG